MVSVIIQILLLIQRTTFKPVNEILKSNGHFALTGHMVQTPP